MEFKYTIADVQATFQYTNSIIFLEDRGPFFWAPGTTVLMSELSSKSRVDNSDSTPSNYPEKTSKNLDFFDNIKSFIVSVLINFNEKLFLQLCAKFWEMCDRNNMKFILDYRDLNYVGFFRFQ